MLDMLAAAGTDAPPAWISYLPIVGMIVIFWFFLFRPQMKRAKEHQVKISGLKRNDKVVTAGGLVGKIVAVDDAYVELELAKGVRVKAVKSTIGDVIAPGNAPAND
ncbi:preprotein translocase subunit YajC [Aurantiacibacter arachoides]|nr:preprotein translocase subunit YajC [Aurantiacibacter arachoides]GGD53770.1 preprotein translocase subunit YajC [Aurantiacibacter arachoides]